MFLVLPYVFTLFANYLDYYFRYFRIQNNPKLRANQLAHKPPQIQSLDFLPPCNFISNRLVRELAILHLDKKAWVVARFRSPS